MQAEIGCGRAPELQALLCRASVSLRTMSNEPRSDGAAADQSPDADEATGATATPPYLARLADRLDRSGLGHWAVAAQEWTLRFAGIERHADADDMVPARCVMRLAWRYGRLKEQPVDAQVADDLARLPFTRWHARWPAWATPNGQSER